MTELAPERTKVDWKGVSTFLLISFAITYALEGILIMIGISPILKGLGQYMVAMAMWVPALAVVLTIKFVTHENWSIANIRLGEWRPYIAIGLIIPVCFILIYGLSWILGLGNPDWNLDYFRGLFAAAGKEAPTIPSPWIFWPAAFFVTLIVAPFFNCVFAFGEELGWRGYLLPKLLPLGKIRAYLLVGIIWGLWHLPLVLAGFMYPGQPLGGILMFTLLTVILSIFINELTRRYQSSLLAGWIHGVINTQRLGFLALLFPNVNPWLGGFSGVIGLVVWAALGVWIIRHKNYKSG